MISSRPLLLYAAGRKDFDFPIRILCLLILLSAVLSPQPLSLTLLVILLLGAGWSLRTLSSYNVSDRVISMTLYPDGQVSLVSAGDSVVQGFVEGRSWCTQWLTVLHIATQGKSRGLLVLSGQQTEDEYRRLQVLLRHNVFAVNNEGISRS